jgi:hypothetical protein
MRVLLLVSVLAACAHVHTGPSADSPTQYELTGAAIDFEAPLPGADEVVGIPCASDADAPSAGACRLEETSPDEVAAFKAEAMRLETHVEPNCRRLGTAMQPLLDGVRMYENAIVRYAGPYKFYGVGHSYQSEGKWMIRIARRLDDLNARTPVDEIRTLRHEMSHTLGARERRVGDAWSAKDYADRCA